MPGLKLAALALPAAGFGLKGDQAAAACVFRWACVPPSGRVMGAGHLSHSVGRRCAPAITSRRAAHVIITISLL